MPVFLFFKFSEKFLPQKVPPMHLNFHDVNDAFTNIIQGIHLWMNPQISRQHANQIIRTVETPSRNGPVIQVDEPMTVSYMNPRNRVLYNEARDANPFFHLYEAMWMLAGRNDVAALKYYASKIDQFSDDGTTFNGAYGYRWRSATASMGPNPVDGIVRYAPVWDQLDHLIDHLKRKPESRRAVLQMWNVEDDLLKIDSSKDVCCNTAVYFSVRTEQKPHDHGDSGEFKYLDMTVTNRSNDIIWGMLGANYVHFTFLQEYVACALGAQLGFYNHFTNNAHIYTETNSGWHPEEWLKEATTPRTMHSGPPAPSYRGPGAIRGSNHYLFDTPDNLLGFDLTVKELVNLYSCGENQTPQNLANAAKNAGEFSPFLLMVFMPAMNAWNLYKKKDLRQALNMSDRIMSPDWRWACHEWLVRRLQKRIEKDAQPVS